MIDDFDVLSLRLHALQRALPAELAAIPARVASRLAPHVDHAHVGRIVAEEVAQALERADAALVAALVTAAATRKRLPSQ